MNKMFIEYYLVCIKILTDLYSEDIVYNKVYISGWILQNVKTLSLNVCRRLFIASPCAINKIRINMDGEYNTHHSKCMLWVQIWRSYTK